jgi:hypothetical protein
VVDSYSSPIVGEFLDRESDLERLNAWWNGPERRPLAGRGERIELVDVPTELTAGANLE